MLCLSYSGVIVNLALFLLCLLFLSVRIFNPLESASGVNEHSSHSRLKMMRCSMHQRSMIKIINVFQMQRNPLWEICPDLSGKSVKGVSKMSSQNMLDRLIDKP